MGSKKTTYENDGKGKVTEYTTITHDDGSWDKYGKTTQVSLFGLTDRIISTSKESGRSKK